MGGKYVIKFFLQYYREKTWKGSWDWYTGKDKPYAEIVDQSNRRNGGAYLLDNGYVVVDADGKSATAWVDNVLNKLGIKPTSYVSCSGNGVHYLFKCSNQFFWDKLTSTNGCSGYRGRGDHDGVDIKGNRKGLAYFKKCNSVVISEEELINGLKNAPEIPLILTLHHNKWPKDYHIFNILKSTEKGSFDKNGLFLAKAIKSVGWTREMFVNLMRECCIINGIEKNHRDEHAKHKWDEIKLDNKTEEKSKNEIINFEEQKTLENKTEYKKIRINSEFSIIFNKCKLYKRDMWCYVRGLWRNIDDEIKGDPLKTLILEEIFGGKELRNSENRILKLKYNEVYNYLYNYQEKIKVYNGLVLKNCYVDGITGELNWLGRDDIPPFTTVHIDRDYNQYAKCEILEKFFNLASKGDERWKEGILKVMAAGLDNNSYSCMALFYSANGGSGKSMLVELLSKIVDNRDSRLNAKSVLEEQSQFSLRSIKNAPFLVLEEIPERVKDRATIAIKSIANSGNIVFEKKGSNEASTEITYIVIGTTNHNISFYGIDDAFTQRVTVFNFKITRKDLEREEWRYLWSANEKAVDALTTKLVDTYRNILVHDLRHRAEKFYSPDTEEYFKKNNEKFDWHKLWVEKFIKGTKGLVGITMTTDEIYEDYYKNVNEKFHWLYAKKPEQFFSDYFEKYVIVENDRIKALTELGESLKGE